MAARSRVPMRSYHDPAHRCGAVAYRHDGANRLAIVFSNDPHVIRFGFRITAGRGVPSVIHLDPSGGHLGRTDCFGCGDFGESQ